MIDNDPNSPKWVEHRRQTAEHFARIEAEKAAAAAAKAERLAQRAANREAKLAKQAADAAERQTGKWVTGKDGQRKFQHWREETQRWVNVGGAADPDTHEAIISIVSEYDRMTVRQLFYQMVARNHVEKTEDAYEIVMRASGVLRKSKRVDHEKIIDSGRSLEGGHFWTNPETIFDGLASFSGGNRNKLLTQPRYLIVWSEKDALASIIQPLCYRRRVGFVSGKGWSSLSLKHEIAETVRQYNKPPVVLYCGDFDPAGQKMSDVLEEQFKDDFDLAVTVKRIALNQEQVTQYNLPTRPLKTSDKLAASFEERYSPEATELDALPPDDLETLVTNAIEAEIDHTAWETEEWFEEQQDRILQDYADKLAQERQMQVWEYGELPEIGTSRTSRRSYLRHARLIAGLDEDLELDNDGADDDDDADDGGDKEETDRYAKIHACADELDRLEAESREKGWGGKELRRRQAECRIRHGFVWSGDYAALGLQEPDA